MSGKVKLLLYILTDIFFFSFLGKSVFFCLSEIKNLSIFVFEIILMHKQYSSYYIIWKLCNSFTCSSRMFYSVPILFPKYMNLRSN